MQSLKSRLPRLGKAHRVAGILLYSTTTWPLGGYGLAHYGSYGTVAAESATEEDLTAKRKGKHRRALSRRRQMVDRSQRQASFSRVTRMSLCHPGCSWICCRMSSPRWALINRDRRSL